MNSKSTLIWILIAAGLAGAVFIVEKFGRQPPAGLVPLLPGFRATEVTSVQFIPAGQLEIRADRTNGNWQLVKPIAYPAQTASIEALLQALQYVAPAHTISGAEERQRKNATEEFGFVPRTTLMLTTAGEPKQLLIGGRTAPGDHIYVKVVGVEGVFLVDAHLLRFLPAKSEDWRDTALVDLRNLPFDRITVSNANVVLQLHQESTNSLWRLTRPFSARADNKRLSESLQKLHATRVTSFVTDDGASDLEAFGLHSPELELTLAHGTNPVVTLQFGRSPTNDSTLVYARRAGLPAVVTVERQALDLWRAAQLNDFRDPHLVTLTRPIAGVEVTGAAPFTLQYASNTWRLAGSDMPVDSELVAEFLLTLVSAPIVDFRDSVTEADLPNYGLAEPSRQIKLRAPPTTGDTNTTLVEISVGELLTNDVVYVQRADEKNSVYALGILDYARLSAASWQFRERKLWDFSENNVVRVTVQRGDRKSELRRSGVNSWFHAPGSQGIVNGVEVEKTVQRLGNLTASAWERKGEEHRAHYGFDTNSLLVNVELKDGTRHQFEIGGTSPENYPYAAVKMGGETWFFEFPIIPYKYMEFTLLNPAAFPP